MNSPFFDVVFYWVTSKVFWIPFYLYLIFLLAKKWGWKTLIIGLFLGLLFFLGDRISVVVFKEGFERLRPCHNPEISSLVHIVQNHCGGQFGFVSSHATNSFSLAIFSGLLFKRFYKYFPIWIILWAALVSYSRIYVGVHYPADIIGGAILGGIIGYLTFWLMKQMDRKFNFKLGL